MTFLKEHTVSLFLIAIAAVFTIFFATYKLSESPAVWYDEGYHTEASIHIALYGTQGLQVAPGQFVSTQYVSSGFPLLYPVAFAYKLFGIGVLQGRAVMVCYIFLFVIAAYLLTRRLFGGDIAAWSILLISSLPMLYGIGKSVLGEVPGLFFLMLSLLALWYLERSGYRSRNWYIAAGLATGLCIVTKPIFLLLMGGFFIAYLLRLKKIRLEWRGVVLGSLTLLVPVVLWFCLQFGLTSSAQVVLPFYSHPYGTQSLSQTIIQNVLRFFTESTPIYSLGLLLVWAAALWVRRKKEEISTAELGGFFFCVLILLAYLRLPGWYRYLFEAIAVALVFLPSSALVVFEYLREKLKNYVPFQHLIFLPYVAFFLLAGLQAYQTAADSYVAQYYNSTTTADVSRTLASLGDDTSFYLYNVPQFAIFLPSQNYYQSLLTDDRVIIGNEQLSVLKEGGAEYVIVSGEDYQKSPDLFVRYRPYTSVGGYELLKKNI